MTTYSKSWKCINTEYASIHHSILIVLNGVLENVLVWAYLFSKLAHVLKVYIFSRSYLDFVLILRPFHFWCPNCALGALTFFASTNTMNETSSWACLSLGIKCSLSMKRVSTVMHCQADWSLIDTHKTCWLVVVRGGFSEGFNGHRHPRFYENTYWCSK